MFGSIIEILLIVAGVFTMLTGALGVLRFPDFYTRLHAAGKGDTLGQGLVLLALMIPAGFTTDLLKLAIIIVFIFILNPTATHALARAAWIAGLRPWTTSDGPVLEQYEGQMSDDDRSALMLPVPAAPTDDEVQAEREEQAEEGSA